MHHCLWEQAHDSLLAIIKEQDKRIAELEDACQLAHDMYDNITTNNFRLGKDKPARDKIESVLNLNQDE